MPNSVSPRAANSIDAHENELNEKSLRERVLRRLLKVRRACVPDLVNELEPATTAQDLKPVITGLLQEGLIRLAKNDENDLRQYTDDRTRYELAE